MNATALAIPGGARTSASRAVGLVLVAVAVAVVHIPGRPATLCLLRATTGIPCPLCGGTTATADLGRGEFAQAIYASPLVVLGAVALALRPLLSRVLLRTQTAVWTAILVAGALSELWELHRFGLV